MIAVDGGDLRRLTNGGRASLPESSPDGREIVFMRAEGVSTSSPNQDLYVVVLRAASPDA